MNNSSLPRPVQNSIESKVSGIVSQRLMWQQAAAKAQGAGCSDEVLARLVDGFASARSLDLLAQLSRRYSESLDEFSRSLVQRVDESAFSLADWLNSLERILVLLADVGRVAPPSTMLGYVHCAAEFVASQRIGEPLPEVVEEMLEQYGFDG